MASIPLADGRRLDLSRPLVMAILNATPDSFSDGGRLPHADAPEFAAALRHVLDAGADILDVGGESTRPGHAQVSVDEELARVLPVIRRIRQESPGCVVSIDTRKAAVAREALAAGADFVNDVSGLDDPAMAGVVRDAGCAVVLMRHRDLSGDVVAACKAELAGLVTRARSAGIPDDALVLDPGLGFGNPPGGDPAANLALLRGVRAYAQGFPVLVGASRKRFIGTLTGEPVASRRVGGSVAAAVEAVEAGAAIVRVHDVEETAAALHHLRDRRAGKSTEPTNRWFP